ncbi:hypothetical protein K443DRAFT_388733 [Laccaria amethystina LaAM-08-1]|uniref:VHS domain-containing protein n=1 Tax=Laccaria amethystina LaAM-08-1 TaxID=1095629 RepID=A0A0C9XX10_9AGAR|nr:hypothetical protein K443DRAFT_388733 [Laccaria amethystina LaAM-08-1]
MKKFFGRYKSKATKASRDFTAPSSPEDNPVSTPIHQKHASPSSNPVPPPGRSPERLGDGQDRPSHLGDGRGDRGTDSRTDDNPQAELTRMIGYLTATASEDWGLVLEVCDRASANEANAKEAVRALRREFKYGEPPAQLSAARLWAIMLRNSTVVFISQSMSRKFLETLEDLLLSSRTSPVVRERLLEVVAAAAYASGTRQDGRGDRDGFRGLWRRVKPYDKPDEGIPFDTDDDMFHPPSGMLSQ